MSLGERTAPSTKNLRGPKFSFTHKKALLVEFPLESKGQQGFMAYLTG